MRNGVSASYRTRHHTQDQRRGLHATFVRNGNTRHDDGLRLDGSRRRADGIRSGQGQRQSEGDFSIRFGRHQAGVEPEHGHVDFRHHRRHLCAVRRGSRFRARRRKQVARTSDRRARFSTERRRHPVPAGRRSRHRAGRHARLSREEGLRKGHQEAVHLCDQALQRRNVCHRVEVGSQHERARTARRSASTFPTAAPSSPPRSCSSGSASSRTSSISNSASRWRK